MGYTYAPVTTTEAKMLVKVSLVKKKNESSRIKRKMTFLHRFKFVNQSVSRCSNSICPESCIKILKSCLYFNFRWFRWSTGLPKKMQLQLVHCRYNFLRNRLWNGQYFWCLYWRGSFAALDFICYTRNSKKLLENNFAKLEEAVWERVGGQDTHTPLIRAQFSWTCSW